MNYSQNWRKFALGCLLSALSLGSLSAAVDCKDRVIREITFENVNDPSSTRWSIKETDLGGVAFDDAAYKYVGSGSFSKTNTDWNNGANNPNTNREYAIVKNPKTLSSQYADIETDGMLVINPKQAENDQYLMYTVNGLKPKETYYIEFKVWNVLALSQTGGCGSWCNWNNQILVKWEGNGNNAHDGQGDFQWTGTNGSGGWDGWGNQIPNAMKVSANGAYAIFTAKMTFGDATTGFTITFTKNNETNPIVLGVDYIKVKGCEDEKIQTSTGSTKVCEFDPLKLTAYGLGSANGTYTWYKNGSKINGANTKTISIEGPANGSTDKYKAVGEYSEKEIEITGASCCSSADKVEVFRETFKMEGSASCGGQFYNLPAGGSVSSVYSFAGSACESGGCASTYVIGGAKYAVVSDLKYGGWWPCWDWKDSQPVKGSHTNDGSGFLLVNANANKGGNGDYFYRRALTSVCPNTTYEFSAYIANIKNGPGEGDVSVKFNIYKGDVLYESSDAIEPEGNKGWFNAKILFTTDNSSDWNVRVVNNKEGDNGNDLALDDITVSKCLLKVNALDDDGNTESEVCSTNKIRITAKLPGGGNMADKFGGATPYYIWQRSTNGTNWTNLGSKTTNNYYEATPEATQYYYRAKIGTQTSVDQEISYDKCAADTYTEMYRLVKNGNLTVSATANPTSLCAGNQITINGSVSGASNPTYSWKYSATGNWESATNLSGNSTTFTKNNAANGDSGTYYFVVNDNGCEAHAGAAVTVKAKPNAPTVTNATPACPGEKMTFQASGVTGATYTWSGSVTGNGASKDVTATSGQTYSGTVYATVDGCKSDDANYSATAKEKPNTPTVTNATPACAGEKMTFQASGVTGATYTWSGSVTGNGASKDVTATSGQTYSGTVYATVDGCKSDNANYSATAKTTPNAPTVTNATPACEGDKMTFKASGVTGATYTWSGSVTGDGASKDVTAESGKTYSGTVYATANGCKSTDSNYSATAKTTPANPTVTNATPACAGDKMTFKASGTAGATYTWEGDITGTGDSKDVTAVSGKTYSGTVYATADGCKSGNSNYSATAKTTPTIQVSEPQCSADLLTYTATITVSAGTASIVSGDGASISGNTLTGQKDKGVVLKVTADGCSSANYTVNAPNCNCDPINKPVDASTAHDYCSATSAPTLSVTATLGANEQVEWFASADCSGTALSTAKTYTPDAANSPAVGTEKSYYVRVRNTTTNCKSEVTEIKLKNKQTPTVTITAATPVCEPNTIDITKTVSGATTYKYYSNPDATIELTQTTVSATTTYYVVGTTDGCASDVANGTATINKKPTLGGTTSVLVGNKVTLTTDVAGGTWSSSNDAVATINATTGEVTAAATITGTSQKVTMTYTTAEGCDNTIEVTVSSFGPMDPDKEIYFCPGDKVTMDGAGQNITRYEWLDASKTAITGKSGTGTSDSYQVEPTTSTVYYFRGCNGNGTTNCLEQKFTLTRREDLSFTVTDKAVACKGDALTLTATATSATPTNVQYDFGSGYSTTATYNPSTATAGLSNAVAVKGKADNYCESTVNVTYDVAEFDAQKDNWKSTVYKNDDLTLKVNATATAPAGYALHYAWEKSTNPAGTWLPAGTDADTYNESKIEDKACYRVTITLTDGTNKLCTDQVLDGCIDVTDIVIGDDEEKFFCPGEPNATITLKGNASGIDGYAWYEKDTTEPMTPETIATEAKDVEKQITATTSTVWYFKVFSGTNTAKQTFTITRNADLEFTATDNIVVCKGDAQTITATATSASPTNLIYDFGEGYNSAATYTLPTATAGTSKTMEVKGKADNYCESTFTTHYDVAEFDAQKDNWKSTVYKNDDLTLKVNATATAPAGYALHYAWEKSTNPAGTWTSAGTDADTYTEKGITEKSCYRVTVTLTDGTNKLCTDQVLDGCIDVTDIVIGDDEEKFFCPGEPNATITLKGNASGIDGYAWYEEGTTEPATPETIATEAQDVEKQITATTSTVWYFKVFSGTNTAKQTFTITRNADLEFTATDNIVVCKGDAQTVTATATSVSPTNLIYDFGEGYNSAATYTLPTATAGTSKTLEIKGKADNYCETEFTTHYDVAELVADKDGAWAESVFNGESVTLKVTTTGTTIPAGYEIKYAWEKDGAAQAETSATYTDTPTADATYKVTVSIVNSTDKTKVLCGTQSFSTTVKIVNIKMGDPKTFYYCPGDDLTLVGSGNNLTGYAWYKDGETEPTTPAVEFATARDVTEADNIHYDLTDIQADTKVYFKGFSGPNSAKQVFTISKHADYKFNLTPATVTTCVNATQPLTINTQKDASITASGETYYWTKDQAEMPTTNYPNVDISVPSASADGTTISVTGEIKPATLTPLVKDSRYCPVSKDFNYKVAKIDVVKGTWKDIICKGDNITVDLTNNSVTPTGTSLSIKWYTKTSTGNWTENTSAKNQTTLTLNSVQETTEIKAEIKMMEGTVEHCDIADITGKVQVPTFTVTPATPAAIGQCYGFPVTFAGNIKVSGLNDNTATYQWSKGGADIAGAQTETYAFTMEDNRETASDVNHTAGTYRLTATVINTDGNSCTATQDWTLNQNPDNVVTIDPSAKQYVCKDSKLVLTASSASSKAGKQTTFTWTPNGLAGAANNDKYTVSTTATGDGTFTVSAKADGYCVVESQPVEVSVSDLSGSIATAQDYVCEDGTTGKTTDLALTVTKNNADALNQTIVWTKNGATLSGETSENLTVSAKGAYKATITTAVGGKTVCTATADFTVKGDALKMGAEKTWPEICSGNEISLEGQADGADATTTYSWTLDGEEKGTGKKLQLPKFETTTPNDALTFIFTAKKNACTDTQIHHITVKPYVEFEVNDVPNVCVGDKKTVVVTPKAPASGATYTWTNGTQKTTGTMYTLPSDGAKSGKEIKVNGSANGYCDSDVKYAYSFTYDISKITLALEFPKDYCPEETVNLGANVLQEGTSEAIDYIWYENGSELAQSGAVIQTNPKGDVTYRVKVTNGICTEEKQQTVKMIITDITPKDGISEKSSCPGDEITLQVTLGDPTSKVTWTKEEMGEETKTTTLGSGSVIKDKPTTDAVYTASLVNGVCKNSVQIEVTMWPVPVIDTVVTVDNPKMVEIMASDGTSPYDYAIDKTAQADYQTGAIFNGVKIGHHTAYVKDANQCKTSYEFTTVPLPLEFPLYFTPNGDGMNDVWNVKNIDIYDKVELIIYDRFGKELFRTNNPLEGWNGMYLDKRLPSTDYWYLLYIEETGKRYTGHFTLVN